VITVIVVYISTLKGERKKERRKKLSFYRKKKNKNKITYSLSITRPIFAVRQKKKKMEKQ
jgi:hypothetical protein